MDPAPSTKATTGKSKSGKSKTDKPKSDKPKSDKPKSDKPKSEKSKSSKTKVKAQEDTVQPVDTKVQPDTKAASKDVLLKPIDSDDLVTLPAAAIEQIVTITAMLEDLGGSTDSAIPFQIRKETLERVVEYVTIHKDDPIEKVTAETITFTQPDLDWIAKLKPAQLFELINAANYLDIKRLLLLGCKQVAVSIKGLKAAEIRELYQIKNDFTPEEEEQARKENEWVDLRSKY